MGHANSENSQSLGLRFETADDAMRYVDHQKQEVARWLAANTRSVIERYERFDAEIVCDFCAFRGDEKYWIRAIVAKKKIGVRRHNRTRTILSEISNTGFSQSDAPSDQKLMGFLVTKTVNGPQGKIASLMRLEPLYERMNRGRDGAGTPLNSFPVFSRSDREGVINVRRGRPKREMGIIGAAISGSGRDRICGLVESRAKVGKNIERYVGKIGRNWLSKDDLVVLNRGLVFFINSQSAWVVFDECVMFQCELLKMFLRPINHALGAVEWAGDHDETC